MLLQADQMNSGQPSERLKAGQWEGANAIVIMYGAPLPGDADLHAWQGGQLALPALDQLGRDADIRNCSGNRLDSSTHDERQAHQRRVNVELWQWRAARDDAVAVDGALYVRGYNGQASRWYKAAVRQKAGRIIAAGMTKEVTFEPIDGSINDLIDEAYRKKYRGSPYLNPMVDSGARSASVRVMPRNTDV